MSLFRHTTLAFLAFAAAAPQVRAQTSCGISPAVQAQMDAASKHFKSAQANFQRDYFQKIVQDTTTDMGSIYFERSGASTDMGAVLTSPGPQSKNKPAKVVQYNGGKLQMFDPGVDQITIINTSANQAEYESFLTLGFGGSATELCKSWDITDNGPETITDGKPIKVEKLTLMGKTPDSRKTFDYITIWVDPATAVSYKQYFHTAAGNYQTATYQNVKLNGSIDKSKFAIKKDKNTTTINH
jgi:outer membrane lipoprotein-sorting protein